jgi:hypothetical protein
MTSPKSLYDELCYVITKMDKQIAEAQKSGDADITDLQRRRDEHYERLRSVDQSPGIDPESDGESFE